MKLWDKGYSIDKKIDIFTVGADRTLDTVLARYDIIGNRAQATMLHSIGVLSSEELKSTLSELDNIMADVEKGDFTIEESFEDVHSKIEFMLTERLGDTGKKIHTARSRNDQVLVDMHLYVKDEILAIKDAVKMLFDLLISLSEKHKDTLLPGYTHLQVAMPSSFGLWFGAYAESLVDDVYLLSAAYKIADQNPLGSAAGYGSSFPIDRELTTSEMDFAQLKVNSVAAQMSRGKLEKSTSFAMASIAATLSKLSMDVCLYMSQNFGFVSFPDELTTGSSIMPHKKNPDVFELIRSKCNKIQTLPMELTMIQNNLPSGYQRDLQLLKESFVPAVSTLKSCLDMAVFMLKNIRVTADLLDDPRYLYVFSVEEVNKLVLSGTAFRDAYKQVGRDIQKGTFSPDKSVKHSHIGSVGNLRNDLIIDKMKNAIKGF